MRKESGHAANDTVRFVSVKLNVKVKLTWGRQVRENPLHLTPYD